MSKDESHKVDYVVMVIGEYAKANRLSVKDAFFQLLECGGIGALDEVYDVEHTLPLSMTVADLGALHARSVA